MNKLAPIVLFVYNRIEHTKLTVKALQKNQLAVESDLFIYSDAPRDSVDKARTDKVRGYINNIDGFKNITIIERETNYGLAASIVDGVTEIVNKYGRVIVLEDDLITSQYFLKFMNDALVFYENEDDVWHISGWNYPIKTDESMDVFLWKVMNCWGWATWKSNWNCIEQNPFMLIENFSNDEIKEFNLDGTENFFKQLEDNLSERINTWAIFWYATIFKRKGLCVNPMTSYVKNIGFDSSGTHCGNSDRFNVDNLNQSGYVKFENNIAESKSARSLVKLFYNKKNNNIIQRVIFKLKRLSRTL